MSRPPATDAGGSPDDANGARADIGRWQAEAAARRASHGSTYTETSGADADAPAGTAPADGEDAPADADDGTRVDLVAVPAETSDPEDTAVYPRPQAGTAHAETSEPSTVIQAPLAAVARPWAETSEPPTTVQAPADRASAPKLPPPAITRPQLILDETLVDMAGARNPRQAGPASPEPGADAASSAPGAGAPDAPQADGVDPEDTGGTPRAQASDPPTETRDPEGTAEYPRPQAGGLAAGPGALPPRAGGPKLPLVDRPADITRPQLILDDTIVDIGGLRGGRNPRQADGANPAPGAASSRTGSAPNSSGSLAAAAPAANGNGTPAGTSSPPTEKPPGKKSRSVFGPEPASRPDMLTDAETVVMPSLKGPTGQAAGSSAQTDEAVANARNTAAVKEQAITTMVPVGTSAFAEAVTQVMPTMERSARPAKADAPPPAKVQVKRDRQPTRRYTPKRRTTMISRLVLLAILCLQAVLSLRLHNTAFEDESLYLYAGHMELQHLLHGTALPQEYAAYFSGAPVLYPVAAAALDQVGGLALARALSLFEMLATTTLLYSLTRRLFNERIGLCAAAFFAVTESAVFLGNFATYDATCLSLLALATWIMVRTAGFRWPLFLLAAPVAALAVGVKYAGLLFVPTIAVLPVLAGWPERGRRVLWYPVGFGAAVAGILLAAVRLGGKAYTTAIQSTTTSRAPGTTPDGTILREAAEWGGVIFALAVLGTVAYVWRVRTEPDERIAPTGGRFRRLALGVVLTGTALLAPADQAHLHTDISFLKHIGFGLFFAAPMAGFGLARIMGDYFRRPQFGIAVWSLALVLGMVQSQFLYHVWPSSGPFVSTFAKYLKPHASYLVEVPEVPIYYLLRRPDAQPGQFFSTFSVPPLATPADFAAVVKAGRFQVIAYNGDVTPANDQALAQALAASHSYYMAAKVQLSDSYGLVNYYIWVKGHKPAQRAAAATGKKP